MRTKSMHGSRRDQQFTKSRLDSCVNVYNIYIKPQGNETDANVTASIFWSLLARCETAKLEDSENPGEAGGANPGGAHDDPM